MAQSFVTDAGTLVIPGAYPSIKVQNGASGLSTTGVLFLLGEADGGQDFTLESELSDNSFGPDQVADVVKKYVSGPLVDAFKVAATPASDPDITGSPNRFILVKTNPSTKASGTLPKIGGGTYGTLFDKSYGQLGNLIYFTVATKTAEVKPTTGAFTYIPPVSSLNANARVDGGADEAFTVTANMTPTAFVAAVDALAGISATGGVNRGVLGGVAGNVALAASGNTITITYDTSWTVTPTAGDTLVISSASVLSPGGDQNTGAYVILSATANSIVATKLSDAGLSGAVAGTITAPGAVSSTPVASTSDVVAYSPATISFTSSTVIDGIGKNIEINELTSGVDLLSRTAYILGTVTPVTWVSKSGAAKQLISSAEYAVTLNVNRQADNVQELLSAGGQIALKVGYTGTSCAVVITPTTMTLTPVGGSGSTQTLTLKNFPTMNDLAAYINAQTGFKCAVGTSALGQLAPTALDEGSFECATDFGNYTLRLKVDAVKFFQVISGNSGLVQLGNPAATALAGIPDVTTATVYLSGGARGATTDAVYDAAVDAIEQVQGNFVVPLFARDASSDIADGLTDSASTYTIANIQAYAKTHCLKMSTLKRRKNRQAFLANRGSFLDAQAGAANLATFRASLAFQDIKATGANGIVQYQPWMAAALAAGMQAAGFYRAIVHKGINCSGVIQAAADFKDSNDTNVEDALLAGLLVAKKSDDGGFIWVSDQTTYAKDNNFVYNSIQAVYTADVIALTCAQRMEKAFVGQSVADVSAALALSALEAIMSDFLRLKLIAPSDDAPKGFKNASIKISGTTMVVQVEVKLAGAIYFIPINFLVSQVTQAAA